VVDKQNNSQEVRHKRDICTSLKKMKGIITMATYPVFGFGHDFGNSTTCQKLISNASLQVERCIPSVACIGSWRKVEAAAAGSGKEVKEILASDHYVLEYDNVEEARRVEKYIGQKVFDDGAKPMDSHGDSSRYWTNNYNLELLMVGSASMIEAQEYGLHVVTGLPISIYLDDPNHAESVKEALLGAHVFTFNGRMRVMHILSVKVIMEGAGALIAYGTNEEVLQGVIDIGGRTTDLFVARGQKPRTANSKGFDMGVQAAADRFQEKFREVYGRSLSLDTRMELLKQHVNRRSYRSVKDKSGLRIPDERMAALIESSLREIGQEIATSVVAAWDDILMEFDKVLVVGGGAHYFTEDIQVRLQQAACTAKPEMANAQGYARLADAMAQRARLTQQRSA
jgi:plasmid segregation protein ParM